MKKISKVLIMIIIILTIVFGFVSTVYALNPLIEKVDEAASGNDEVAGMGGKIVGIVQTVGTVIAVAILVVLGIKYVMGSAEEKANYKKSMIPYLIGAVLVFATTNIVGVLFSAIGDIN